MILDEKSIYDKELKTTGGKFQEVKSEKTSISDQPSIKMVQRSGSNPVALTVRGLSLVKAEKQTAPSEKQTAPAEKQTAPAEKQTAPAEKQTAPAEKQTAPAEKQTAPVEKPTIPSEKSTIPVERPTVSEEEPTIPAEVTQTEAAQQTARSSGGSKTGGGRESGGFISVSNLETKTVTGPGIPTTSGPIEITPNEGGHNHMINKAVLYILPLLAAIMA
jgi:outer membrane biosynthesis protein TonB